MSRSHKLRVGWVGRIHRCYRSPVLKLWANAKERPVGDAAVMIYEVEGGEMARVSRWSVSKRRDFELLRCIFALDEF